MMRITFYIQYIYLCINIVIQLLRSSDQGRPTVYMLCKSIKQGLKILVKRRRIGHIKENGRGKTADLLSLKSLYSIFKI